MEEDISKKVMEMADTLRKAGLASSQLDAIEKAVATLKAQQIVKQAHDNEDIFKKDIPLREIVKEGDELEKKRYEEKKADEELDETEKEDSDDKDEEEKKENDPDEDEYDDEDLEKEEEE